MKRPGFLPVIFYLLALLMIAGGGTFLTVSIIGFVKGINGSDTFFLAPGSAVYTVDKAGKCIIWNTVNGTVGGRMYPGSRTLPPDLAVTVAAIDRDASPLPLGSAGNMRKSTGSQAAEAVYSFNATVPGRYQVTVGGAFASRVFSVGPDIVPLILKFGFGVGGGIFAGIAGFLLPGAGVILHSVWAGSRSTGPPPNHPDSITKSAP